MSKYKRYEKYKDSGIEWIGEIPEHWEINKLKRLSNIITGNTPSKSEEENYDDEGIPWVKPDNIQDDGTVSETKERLSVIGLQKARLIPKNSAIVCCIGTVGKVGFTQQDCTTNQQINSIIFDRISIWNSKYGFYCLYSSKNEHEKYSNKVVVSILNKTQQGNILMPVPSLKEQKAIASFLDQKTAEIDDLIADKEKLIELLQEKRQAIITEAVTKGLNPNVKMKDSGIEWIGEIPEHWDVIKLKYVTKLVYGDSLPTENREEGEVDVFGSNGKVGTHNVANTLSPVIIVGRKGSYGKVTYSDKKCFAIDTTYYIDNRCTKSNIKWLYYSLMVLELDKNSQDTGVPGLSREYAYNKYVPVPTVNEQVAIANFLDQKTAEIDGLIADKEKLIELLQEKRQAIITEAVTKGLNPNVKMKDSGIEWIGEIPEHWELNKLKYVIRNGKEGIKIGPFGSSLKLDDMDESNPYKVYGQENIINNDFTRGNRFITQEKFNEMCGYQLFSGDIVISMMGTIGKCKVIPLGIQPGIMDSHLIRLRTNNGVMLPKFLEYLIDNTNYVKEQMNYMSKGSIMSGLNSSIIKEIILVIPSVVEQKEIIDFLEQKTAEIDDLVTKIKIQIQKLKEYRQSLISEAVTGKIDVRVFENKDEVIYSEQDSSPCRELTHVAE